MISYRKQVADFIRGNVAIITSYGFLSRLGAFASLQQDVILLSVLSFILNYDKIKLFIAFFLKIPNLFYLNCILMVSTQKTVERRNKSVQKSNR